MVDGIEWNQILTIVGIILGSGGFLTFLYNWYAKRRELLLQKRTKRAEWLMQSRGRYNRLGIVAGQISDRLSASSIEYDVCFYSVIQYFKALHKIYENEASYFFDDIQGEYFLLFLEKHINEILKGELLFGSKGWVLVRDAIGDEQNLTDLLTILKPDSRASDKNELKELFDKFTSFLKKPDSVKLLKMYFFIYHFVLLLEINKLVIALYKDERGARKTLKKLFESSKMSELSELIDCIQPKFKAEFNMDFKMFNWRKRLKI